MGGSRDDGGSAPRTAPVRPSSVVLPLQLVFAINGVLYGSLLPRFPQIVDRLDASEGSFGLALLGMGLGGVLGSATVTAVTRRLGGPSRVVVWAGPLVVAAMAAAGVAPTLWWFFVALVVAGIADGMVDPSMNAVGSAIQDRDGVPIMGRLHASWSGATLAATGVGALVAALGIGVVPHVLVVAGVSLPVLVVASRRVEREVGDLNVTDPTAPSPTAPDPAGHGGTTAPAVATPADGPPRWLMWAATIVVAMAAILIEIPPQEWAALLLERELGAGPGVAGAAPFTFLGGVLAGRLVLDRVVAVRGWRWVGVAAASASLVGMTIALVVGATTRSPWPLFVGLAIAGVGAAPHFPLLFARAGTIARRLGIAVDAGAGVISTVTRAAMLVGPVVVGQVAERAGLFVGLAIVPVTAALMIPSLLLLLPRRR